MKIKFNGTRLFILTLLLLLLKLVGVVEISFFLVFLPILSPLIVSFYLLFFTELEIEG